MMLNVEYSKPDKLAQPLFFLSLARLNYLSEKFVKNFAILFCSFTLCLFIVVVFLFTIHSFINPSIHPFIHSVSQSASQSFVYSLIRSFSRSFTCVKLLFCFPDKVSKKHSVFNLPICNRNSSEIDIPCIIAEIALPAPLSNDSSVIDEL